MAIRMLAVLYHLGVALFTDPVATACLLGLSVGLAIVAAVVCHHLDVVITRPGRKHTDAARAKARTGALDTFQDAQRIFRSQNPAGLRGRLTRHGRRP